MYIYTVLVQYRYRGVRALAYANEYACMYLVLLVWPKGDFMYGYQERGEGRGGDVCSIIKNGPIFFAKHETPDRIIPEEEGFRLFIVYIY